MAQQAYVASDLKAGRLVVPFGEAVQTTMSYFLVCSTQKAKLPKNMAFVRWLTSIVDSDS